MYKEGKEETLTHPFIKNEPILTREDKSYKEAKRLLNELVKYEKSHQKSVIKNWILMCVIFTLLLVQILMMTNFSIIEVLFYVIPFCICLMALITVTTCLDVPCGWNCGHKIAKFSMFRNLHKFRLVLLILYFVIILVYAVVKGCCLTNDYYYDRSSGRTMRPAICEISEHIYLTIYALISIIILCPVAYIFIMIAIINRGCYRNRFSPVLSCKNIAHEIILIDIFDENTICKGKKHRLPDNVIENI